jgi:hypothetical protein
MDRVNERSSPHLRQISLQHFSNGVLSLLVCQLVERLAFGIFLEGGLDS